MVKGEMCIINGAEAQHTGTLDENYGLTVDTAVARTGNASWKAAADAARTAVLYPRRGAGAQIAVESLSFAMGFRLHTRAMAGGFPVEHSICQPSPSILPEIFLTDDAAAPRIGVNLGIPATQRWKGSFGISLDTFYVLWWNIYRAGNSYWPLRVKLYSNDGLTLHDDSDWLGLQMSSSLVSLNAVTFGAGGEASPGFAEMNFDDIVAVTGGAGAPIAAKVMGLFPNAVSGVAGENDWIGTANKWDDVDEAPSNEDTDYIKPSTTAGLGQQLFTHPATGLTTEKIHGVRLLYRIRKAGTTTGTAQGRLRNQAGTMGQVGPLLGINTTYEYGQSILGRETGGSAEWTVAKVDALQFGMNAPITGTNREPRVTQELLEVAYGGVEWTDDYEPRINWNDVAEGPGRPALVA
jgi:hypothetical protein